MSDENDHSQIIDNIQNEEEISTDEIFVETDKVLEAETIIKEINVVPHEEVGAETIVDEINVVLHEVVEAAMSTDEIPAVPDKVVLNCCDIITARYNEKLNELEDKIKEVEEKKSVKELMLTRAENTIKKLKSQNKDLKTQLSTKIKMDLDINSNKGCSKDLQIKQEIVKDLEIKLDEERLVAKNLLRRQKVEFTQKTQIVQALLSEKYDSKQISEFHDKIVGTSSVWDNLNREKCVVLVPQLSKSMIDQAMNANRKKAYPMVAIYKQEDEENLENHPRRCKRYRITDPENEKNAKKTKKETVKLRFPEQL